MRPWRNTGGAQSTSESVIGDACVNAVLEAEPPHDALNLARIPAYNLRTAVGKNRTMNPCLLAPAELKGDWSMPD